MSAVQDLDPVIVQLHELVDALREQNRELERSVRIGEAVIRGQQADIATLNEAVGDAQARVNAHREATSRLSTKLDAARSRIDGADALLLEALEVVEGLLEAPDAHLTRASELLADVRTWREVAR